jgi:hypothetical protein
VAFDSVTKPISLSDVHPWSRGRTGLGDEDV